jgi:signal transduction histidine kinase
MKGKGKLEITVHRAPVAEAGTFVLRPRESTSLVELRVADSGPGIAPAILPRIFEPFFTTKTAGAKQGTGLGLSMVYSIAEQEGLGIVVDSSRGGGAAFHILLPASDAEPKSEALNPDEHHVVREPVLSRNDFSGESRISRITTNFPKGTK